MAQAKQGDKVRIDYTGTLDDGTIFDSTLEGDECGLDECKTDDCEDDECGCSSYETGPMELTIGAGDFFPQIEEAIIGMAPGDKKKVFIPVDEAFGEYEDERIFTVSRKDLPDDLNPEVGDRLGLTDENDVTNGVTVVEVTDESITFDANHPLAGEDLTFEIALLEIL